MSVCCCPAALLPLRISISGMELGNRVFNGSVPIDARSCGVAAGSEAQKSISVTSRGGRTSARQCAAVGRSGGGGVEESKASTAVLPPKPMDHPGTVPAWRHVELRQLDPIPFVCPETTFAAKLLKHAPEHIPPLFPADVDVLSLQHPSLFRDQPKEAGRLVRPILDQALRAKGAVLLQGLLPISPESAGAFVEGLGYTHQEYEPFGGKRKKLLNLDLATNVPGPFFLDLHNEMVYNPKPCSKIGLICLEPAPQGGESLVGSTRDVLNAIPEHVVQRFEEKGGVLYARHYGCNEEGVQRVVESLEDLNSQCTPPPSALDAEALNAFPLMTWQERTQCEDPYSAAAFWVGLGCHVCWYSDGSMVVWNDKPAVGGHPRTGELLWFNLVGNLVGNMLNVYGTGEMVEDEIVDEIVKARVGAMRQIPLVAGEMLVLDNWLWMHGRTPFEGPRTMATMLTSD